MVIAHSKVVPGWLSSRTDKKFPREPLWAAVGNDDVLHVGWFSIIWLNGITMFHCQNHMGHLLSLFHFGQNILSSLGSYHVTHILLFFSLLTEVEV